MPSSYLLRAMPAHIPGPPLCTQAVRDAADGAARAIMGQLSGALRLQRVCSAAAVRTGDTRCRCRCLTRLALPARGAFIFWVSAAPLGCPPRRPGREAGAAGAAQGRGGQGVAHQAGQHPGGRLGCCFLGAASACPPPRPAPLIPSPLPARPLQLLGAMAHCAPKQLGSCLPVVVPRLGEVLADPHPKVAAAAKTALNEVGSCLALGAWHWQRACTVGAPSHCKGCLLSLLHGRLHPVRTLGADGMLPCLPTAG